MGHGEHSNPFCPRRATEGHGEHLNTFLSAEDAEGHGEHLFLSTEWPRRGTFDTFLSTGAAEGRREHRVAGRVFDRCLNWGHGEHLNTFLAEDAEGHGEHLNTFLSAEDAEGHGEHHVNGP